jgi:hypothetical protein
LPDIVAEVTAAFERYGTLSSQTTPARAMRAPFANLPRATMRSGVCVPRARRALLAVLENIRKTSIPGGRKTNCAGLGPGMMSNSQVL